MSDDHRKLDSKSQSQVPGDRDRDGPRLSQDPGDGNRDGPRQSPGGQGHESPAVGQDGQSQVPGGQGHENPAVGQDGKSQVPGGQGHANPAVGQDGQSQVLGGQGHDGLPVGQDGQSQVPGSQGHDGLPVGRDGPSQVPGDESRDGPSQGQGLRGHDRSEPTPATKNEPTNLPDEPQGRGARSKTFTKKGLQYKLDMLNKRRSQVYRTLERLSKGIQGLMHDNVEQSVMQSAFSKWLVSFEDFLDVQSNCHVLPVNPDALEWFHEKMSSLCKFKANVEEWFLSKSRTSESPAHDKQSVYNESCRSSKVSSKGSNRSSLANSIASARIKEEQRQAELATRAELLEQKQELEKEKLRLKLEEEQLELNTELAVSAARSKALENFESGSQNNDRDSCTRGRTDKHLSLNPIADVFVPKLSYNTEKFDRRKPHYDTHYEEETIRPIVRHMRPQTKTKRPTEHLSRMPHSIDRHLQHYDRQSDRSSDEAIQSIVRHMKKPPTEIKKFSGDPLEFRRFIRQFRSNIVSNTEDDDERMNYLEQYTVGEPNKVVAGYGYLDAAQGYAAAVRELEERYGDSEVIANCYIKKAVTWPAIKADNPRALDEFGIFLAECENAVKNIEAMQILEYGENLKSLISKLPYYLHDRWRNVVQEARNKGSRPRFSQLVNLVKMEAKKAMDPVFGRDALTSDKTTQPKKGQGQKTSTPHKKGSFAACATETTLQRKPKQPSTKEAHESTEENVAKPNTKRVFSKPCIYCDDQQHAFDTCPKFVELTPDDKSKYVMHKGLCFGCLRQGHQKKACKNKATCTICKRNHPTLLHIYGDKPISSKPAENVSPSTSPQCASIEYVQSTDTGAGLGEECTMAIVPVKCKMKNGLKVVDTYAFLDSGSSATFCSDSLMRQLGCSGKQLKLTFDTMGTPHTMYTHALKGLEVSDLEFKHVIELPRVFTKDRMPVSKAHIPTQDDIAKWSHLSGVELPQIDAEVGLLIGNNVPDAYTPKEVRTGPTGSPHATKTSLGWIAWNVIRSNVSCNLTVNRTDVALMQEVEKLNHLDQLVRKSYEVDFPERHIDDRKQNSQDDNRFLKQTEESIQIVDGHYQIPLPFRQEDIQMPNNYSQVVHRLRSLERKLRNNPKCLEDYSTFMTAIIEKGFAEKVPEQELIQPTGKVWYIPHHGVYHPRKPEKIRVVLIVQQHMKASLSTRCYYKGLTCQTTLSEC